LKTKRYFHKLRIRRKSKIRFYKSIGIVHNLIARNLFKTGYKLKIYEINPEIQKNIVAIEGGKEYIKIE